MPLGLTQGEVNGFYSLPELAFGKSIQPAYKFVASFLENPFKPVTNRDIGPMPVIMPWHITSVTIPNYQFKMDKVMYGVVPKVFPLLDFEEALKLKVTFEEDELGTIAYFINWMQRNIIDRDGYYRAPQETKIGHFVVEVQDRNGFPVLYYVFKNIVFHDASDPTFDYTSNEVIKYDITFVSEILETWFVKYGAISKVQQKVSDFMLQQKVKALGVNQRFKEDLIRPLRAFRQAIK